MSEDQASWPRPMSKVTGPYRKEKIEGAALSLGEVAPATLSLFREGIMIPDMMSGLTLFLIARQPRASLRENADGDREESGKAPKKRGAPGVSGGIWVREQATYHHPLLFAESFTTEGASTGRHVHKGRRYATTESVTENALGQLASTNRTTGLLSYRVDPDLEDSAEGQLLDDMPEPAADWTRAGINPHLEELAGARVGEILGDESLVISLEMMAVRDTENPENPIHSDPESARAAGLKKPIAGGSHVQAFALETVMARFGPGVLLHGAYVDSRWKMPTEAGDAITPRAEIVVVEQDRVEIALEVRHETGSIAMVGRILIPRPR